MDKAHELTDKELEKLEKRIAAEYKKAADEMQGKVDAYFQSFAKRDAEQKALIGTIVNGKEYTEQDYKQWRLAQIGRGKRMEDLRDQLADRMTKANEVAAAYINDTTPGIYSLNRNYAAYTIEQVAGDVGFTLLDEQTVKRLIVEQPDLMPYYPEKRAVKRGIDLKWGKQQITAQVTTGIIQGESIKNLSDRLQTNIPNMNRDSAIRAARTAVTGAQNAGRMDSYEAAKVMGIKLRKQWLATLDGRTRHAHAMLDGQTAETDKPFDSELGPIMFPGDPSAEPSNIYNCRCTLIADVDGVDTSDAQRRARDPDTGRNKLIEDMTYAEWAGWKKQKTEKQTFAPAKTKSEAEQYALMFADSVSYSGISIENCNIINETLTELQKKYPFKKYDEIKGDKAKAVATANYRTLNINGSKIGVTHAQETFEMMRKQDESALESIKSRYKRYIPPDIKKKIDKLEKNLKFDRWAVFQTHGTKAVITHEYGHTLSDQYFGMISGAKANQNALSAKCKSLKDLISETRKKAWETGDIFSVSRYSATDDDEFFAEVFAMREMGEKIPDYFNKMLEDALKHGAL